MAILSKKKYVPIGEEGSGSYPTGSVVQQRSNKYPHIVEIPKSPILNPPDIMLHNLRSALPRLPKNPVMYLRWAKWGGLEILGGVRARKLRKGSSNPPTNLEDDSTRAIEKVRAEGKKKRVKPIGVEWLKDNSNPNKWTEEQLGTVGTPQPITIIDLEEYKNFIASNRTKGYSYITLYTVPSDVTFTPTPNFSVIASIGRNAPFYHYTGSEDVLSFNLDWYAKKENRSDVINNCRWLATRSKSDGYYGDPHRVIIVWGTGNLFATDVWIISKATYKLTQFQKHQGLLPNQAYQELELKKVIDTNTNYQEHMGIVMA